ncbi:MAG: phenylacetate--CoA ligase family protein [Thermodesulfobacteriota bacterium]
MSGLEKLYQIAFQSREHIRDVQEKRLQDHLSYCLRNSPYYRELLRDKKITPAEMNPDSLTELPLTSKSDLEANNDKFYAVDNTKIADIVFSSGTTGQPTKMVYSNQDLERLAYNEEKAFAACGMQAGDTVLLTTTLDRSFIAGLAYYSGATRLGAAVIRNGQNTLENHRQVMERLQPSFVVGVPTFLKKLGRYLQANSPAALENTSKLVLIGEPIRDRELRLNSLGRELESLWGSDVYSTYASSETITSFCECTAKQGGHLHPDLAIVEILDENNQPCAAGKTGEVVITPLAMEAMPLLRFKTGDISYLIQDPCQCGRTAPRLGPILGRKNQMMKVRGTTLYPPAIFEVLETCEEILDYYVTVDSENELSDEISVHISLASEDVSREYLLRELQSRLRVKPNLVIQDRETVNQTIYNIHSRKPIRFFDRRK